MKFSAAYVILAVCFLAAGCKAFRNASNATCKRSYIIWARPLNDTLPDCIRPHNATSEQDDFPTFLPKEDIAKGGVVLCCLVGIYCFTFLALICNDYFIPCVELFCEVLNLSPDVAAATFMSVATTAPELFINIIATFITESDIGIGTIIGSSMYNSLGVSSVGSFAAKAPIQMDWWPVTRDVGIYIVTVSMLVGITWDGYVWWYEALILFISYFVYFIVMFQSPRVSRFIKRRWERSNKVEDLTKEMEAAQNETKDDDVDILDEKTDDDEETWHPCRIPKGSIWTRVFYFYSWPLKLILLCTVPDPKRLPKLFPITFIFCIVFIGINSYMVSWMITIIGTLLYIPDAVLGMTFLAGGGVLPEAISITIMSRRGEGKLGVSNSLGGNSMNILMSLGIPWFLKSLSRGLGSHAYVKIQSGSVEYTIIALVVIALILYVTLYFNKFQLRRRVGYILLSVLVCTVTLALLSQMVFFSDLTVA